MEGQRAAPPPPPGPRARLPLAPTEARGPVAAAVAGRPPAHVAGAVGRPEAAVVEADDVVEPVGEARHAGRGAEGGRAPVVAAIRGAAAGAVGRQDLCAFLGVAALLAGGVPGAGGPGRSGRQRAPRPRAPPRPTPRVSPGLHGAHAVHGPGVVGAHAAPLHVAAVVRLQSGGRLSGSASPIASPTGPSDPSPPPGASVCPPVRSWPHVHGGVGGTHVEAAGVGPGLG